MPTRLREHLTAFAIGFAASLCAAALAGYIGW